MDQPQNRNHLASVPHALIKSGREVNLELSILLTDLPPELTLADIREILGNRYRLRWVEAD